MAEVSGLERKPIIVTQSGSVKFKVHAHTVHTPDIQLYIQLYSPERQRTQQHKRTNNKSIAVAGA